MKSNTFRYFLDGCKSFWHESHVITIFGVIELLAAVYLIVSARPHSGLTAEQSIGLLALGLAIVSMAITQFQLLGNMSYEKDKLEIEKLKRELEQREFELTLSKFDEVVKKLNTIEERITKRKRKDG